MAAQWISDGSEQLSIEGNVVNCILETSGGNVYNALWKEGDGETSGSHYWKIHFDKLGEHDGAFAGVTDLDKFKKGWATKGLLYGGNLSNGGALLVGDFGPRIKIGDVLGIFVIIENGSLKVYFDLNDSPLGLAFDVPKTVLNTVFPIVHFSGAGSARIEKVAGHPKSLIKPPPTYVGILGDWKLVDNEFKINGAVQSLDRNPTMRITKHEAHGAGEAYGVHLHVLNHANFTLERKGGDQPWVTPGGRMSTLMGGSPEMMKLESDVNKLTTDPTLLELSGEILVINNTANGMESKWQRYSTEKEPVKANPFH